MEFNPQNQLRSKVIKKALKAFVVGTLTKKYQVCAVRSLCLNGTDREKTWLIRRMLESSLEQNPHIVCFFSCITALKEKKKKVNNKKFNHDENESDSDGEYDIQSEEVFCPGIAFWIVFDWPESGLAAFEEYISREILTAGLDIDSCKAIRGRGKDNFLQVVLISY